MITTATGKVRKIYFQDNKGNHRIPLVDKNSVRYKFLKLKCSKWNPTTYYKYMPLDSKFKIPNIVGRMVKITHDNGAIISLGLIK